MSAERYDFAIIGAGSVGLIAADFAVMSSTAALASCEPGGTTPLLVLALDHPLAASALTEVAAVAPVALS